VVQVDLAVASLLESEMAMKQVLLLLDLAREGTADQGYISVHKWQQIIRDFT